MSPSFSFFHPLPNLRTRSFREANSIIVILHFLGLYCFQKRFHPPNTLSHQPTFPCSDCALYFGRSEKKRKEEPPFLAYAAVSLVPRKNVLILTRYGAILQAQITSSITMRSGLLTPLYFPPPTPFSAPSFPPGFCCPSSRESFTFLSGVYPHDGCVS